MTEYGKCVTHHHACDCREDRFKQIERERDELRSALTTVRDYFAGDEETDGERNVVHYATEVLEGRYKPVMRKARRAKDV